ncbi:MAG: regulatory iron-sulfur-containing complex subunit RicT [Bacteroides sp.]
MDFKLNKGSCCMGKKGCSKVQDSKLNTYDWLCDVPDAENATDYVEVQFKNTRKGYFLNNTQIPLEKGDLVAVEASPGHDIGTISLTGKLVLLQMKKNNVRTEGVDIKRVYRKAKPTDIEKYEEAKAKEHATMIRSRQIAAELKLNMKIGDVEYQGDGNKAIFYYIADERVDFRQLIKVLAENFRVRIEMKQIGARQEAGRIGGIGPCGRELCCSSWMTSFVSVATGAARYQDISMNPQKLAGQCAKLKCCINYEVDAYVEAQKRLPSREIVLETKDCNYYHFKTDMFKREVTYSTDKSFAANLITISADRAFDVIGMNKKGTRPVTLEADTKPQPPKRDAQDILGQDSVTRFDSTLKKKKKKPRIAGENGKEEEGSTPANNRNEKGNGNRNAPKAMATPVPVAPDPAAETPVAETVNNEGGNKSNGSGNANNRVNNRSNNNNRNNNNRPKQRPKINNDKQTNNDKPQQTEKPERTERPDKPERPDRPERQPRQEKPSGKPGVAPEPKPEA